ncbi:hypothetical protein M231_04925 [Tremella mesenterica]|uniref:Uncharacterized protein n=1 Tax=Tremella mesenterica TaxID=5217 RepID=A0A4Q1BJ92_TREME|nr:hypothetical protein M231_04925 [Tremella mesenterica]
MKKTLGPITVIDTKPQNAPYRRWNGNQATVLFFPTFAAFLIILLSSLSDPIIPGLTVAEVKTVNGTVSFGTWGWCTSGVKGFDDVCSNSGIGKGGNLNQLGTLVGLVQITGAVPKSYHIANGVMHIFANVSTWLTVVWTLAACGAWENKELQAYDWTRWAFAGTFWSSILVLIAWALDLGMFGKVSGIQSPDGSQPHISPGPSVFMMMAAFILLAGCFIARIAWLKFKPRPLWTVKGADEDFHNVQPPMSAALPPAQDLPPTWESLEINTPGGKIEKHEYGTEVPSIAQPGFAI